MANVNRHRWTFGNGEYLLKNRDELIQYHFERGLALTLRIFEYKGLPDSIPHRELEKILQLFKFAYWKKVDGKLYVFFGGLGGRLDEYYRPTLFTVANPYLEYSAQLKVDEDGVIMWNDFAHMGMYTMLRRYAELMAECDITIRFGLINARLVSVMVALDDNAKTSAELFLKDVEDGQKIGVVMGKGFEEPDGTIRVNDYRRASGQDIKDVIELQQYIKASFYNEIGLQANFNMKREAINGEEAGMNEEALKPFLDDMLSSRREGLEKINKMFGENITVDYTSSFIARKKLGDETKEENQKTEIVDEQKEEVTTEKEPEEKGESE